jgi:hypothetical protein
MKTEVRRAAISKQGYFVSAMFVVLAGACSGGHREPAKTGNVDYTSEEDGFSARFPARPSEDRIGSFNVTGAELADRSVYAVLYSPSTSISPSLIQDAFVESILVGDSTVSSQDRDESPPGVFCSQFVGSDARSVLQGRVCVSTRGTTIGVSLHASDPAKTAEGDAFLSSLTPVPTRVEDADAKQPAATGLADRDAARSEIARGTSKAACDYGAVVDCYDRADEADLACRLSCLAAGWAGGPFGSALCAAACFANKRVLRADCERGRCGSCSKCEPSGMCSSSCSECEVCGLDVDLFAFCEPKCPQGFSCTDGMCDCPSGQRFCADDPQLAASAGSCVDVSSSSEHCGDCATQCNANASCLNGHCGCPQGESECLGECVNLDTDERYCGGCGSMFACSGYREICSGGTCTCRAGESSCAVPGAGNKCTDTQTDDRNCGACGKPCAGDQTCANGQCECTDPQKKNCDGQCIDVSGDKANCGECGLSCAEDQVCSRGECVQCSGVYLACHGTAPVRCACDPAGYLCNSATPLEKGYWHPVAPVTVMNGLTYGRCCESTTLPRCQ